MTDPRIAEIEKRLEADTEDAEDERAHVFHVRSREHAAVLMFASADLRYLLSLVTEKDQRIEALEAGLEAWDSEAADRLSRPGYAGFNALFSAEDVRAQIERLLHPAPETVETQG